MPATSPQQQAFMGADLARARAGKKTKTGMGADKLAEMAAKPKGGYPKKKPLPKRGSGLLSPLGQRTLAGYQQKWGDEAGHTKFESAVSGGILSRDRMFKSPGPRASSGTFQARPGGR